MALTSYRELIAWQKAMEFVVEVYRITAQFPRHEIYGLTQQLRRATVSIPSNIAEGQARHSTREFANFLSIALGSLAEAETQIMIAQRLQYLLVPDADALLLRASEIGRITNGLKNSLTTDH